LAKLQLVKPSAFLGHSVYMLPWTHPSPTKWHLDRFSPFCTAHNREFLYFTMGCHPHSKLPIRVGRYGPHRSLGPPYSASQTACRSVQRFLQGSRSWQTDRRTDRPPYSVC